MKFFDSIKFTIAIFILTVCYMLVHIAVFLLRD